MTKYTRTATRLRSSNAYRVSEKQRQDRANCRFRDEVSEGLWKRDGTAGKDFHKSQKQQRSIKR